MAFVINTLHHSGKAPTALNLVRSESVSPVVSHSTASSTVPLVALATHSDPTLGTEPMGKVQPALPESMVSQTSMDAVSPEQVGRLLVGLGHAVAGSSDFSVDLPTSATRIASTSKDILLLGNASPDDAQVDGDQRAPSEAVGRVVTARESRAQQLIADASAKDASGTAFDDNADVVRSRERIVNRLVERGFNDTYSRMGLGGDRVSVKF
jgi:hypothetical protein